MRYSPGAFTLVELLVVITIIVVLLSLLAPTMDTAVYQAELAVCGAQMKTVASAVTSYATENGRLYPHRATTAHTLGTAQQAGYVFNIVHPDPAGSPGRDDRPYLARHMSLKNLVDPLGGKIDLHAPRGDGGNWVMSNYPLWFGVQFTGPNAGKRMRRIGDRLEWIDRSRDQVRQLRSSILLSDLDAVYAVFNGVTDIISSHPESEPKLLWFHKAQEVESLNTVQTFSWWWNRGTARVDRNVVDLNYGYADNSVRRLNGVQPHDDDMSRVPLRSELGGKFEDENPFWHQLPFEQ